MIEPGSRNNLNYIPSIDCTCKRDKVHNNETYVDTGCGTRTIFVVLFGRGAGVGAIGTDALAILDHVATVVTDDGAVTLFWSESG
ncbi:hypothetical protein DPMN_133792 [Dreissena polymorpha]|uniref:Uncharacterized protein n=1 Tax=Dreissena polymorpha TaxID=45954 RepID=A0A9D4JD82_DREPO|nr:hypothetical protein DPMN_133792 [Dreissena polymorpha]